MGISDLYPHEQRFVSERLETVVFTCFAVVPPCRRFVRVFPANPRGYVVPTPDRCFQKVIHTLCNRYNKRISTNVCLPPCITYFSVLP